MGLDGLQSRSLSSSHRRDEGVLDEIDRLYAGGNDIRACHPARVEPAWWSKLLASVIPRVCVGLGLVCSLAFCKLCHNVVKHIWSKS